MTTRAELADLLAAYDEVTAAYAAVSSRPSSTVHEIEVRHVVRDAAGAELAKALRHYLDEHPEAP